MVGVWKERAGQWGCVHQIALPLHLGYRSHRVFVLGRSETFSPVEMQTARRLQRLLVRLDRQVLAYRDTEDVKGTGYELDAITAVVLGGTSVFGGRGTIGGTLLGLFALAVLQTGLHLAAWPSELTGVLTGVLLLTTIAADRHIRRRAHVRDVVREELEVKNSQCGRCNSV